MQWSNKSFLISWYRTMVDCLLGFAESLVGLLTLGIYTPHWAYRYTIKIAKKELKEKCGTQN